MAPCGRELAAVRERNRAGSRAWAPRSRPDHPWLAVTKLFPAAVIREAYELGLREFGENYVREFEEKGARRLRIWRMPAFT